MQVNGSGMVAHRRKARPLAMEAARVKQWHLGRLYFWHFAQYQLQHADYTLTPPQHCTEKGNSFVSSLIPVTYLGTPYLPPKLNS